MAVELEWFVKADVRCVKARRFGIREGVGTVSSFVDMLVSSMGEVEAGTGVGIGPIVGVEGVEKMLMLDMENVRCLEGAVVVEEEAGMVRSRI